MFSGQEFERAIYVAVGMIALGVFCIGFAIGALL